MLTKQFEEDDLVPKESNQVVNVAVYEDFSQLLKDQHFSFEMQGDFLHIGQPLTRKGWKLHLTVMAHNFTNLFLSLSSFLKENQIPFKIPKNKAVLKSMLAGFHGMDKVGKAITIYPNSDEESLKYAKLLIPLTIGFKGPQIFTDFHLDSNVFAKYGAYPNSQQDGKNKITTLSNQSLTNNQGSPMQDENGKWPFNDITSPNPFTEPEYINERYKPVKVLKTDASGNVVKALYMKSLFNIKWCVIKQGRAHMSEDDYGRDIRDKLAWQRNVHDIIGSDVNIAGVIDFFEQEGSAYLAMQYIKGVRLDEYADKILNGRAWIQLSIKEKIKIVNILIKAIELIEKVHAKGIVHRDITPANFLISKDGNVFLIDFELSFSIIDKYPVLPFEYGTPFFMSPEQMRIEFPTIKEDIYGLGAMLLSVLTGLWSNKFSVEDNNGFISNTRSFIGDDKIPKLLSECLAIDPFERPMLNEVKMQLLEFKSRICGANESVSGYKIQKKPVSDIEDLIQSAINGLGEVPLLSSNMLWNPGISIEQDYTGKSLIGLDIRFIDGAAGVLYTIAKLKSAHFNIDNLSKIVSKSTDHLLNANLCELPDGLLEGNAGIGMSVAKLINTGLLEKADNNIRFLHQCFENISLQNCSLKFGSAGIGLALLHSKSLLLHEFYTSNIMNIVDHILGSQEKDGSWGNNLLKGWSKKVTGFAEGVAGIISFLSEYSNDTTNNEVLIAIDKGLKWLAKISRKEKGGVIWETIPGNKEVKVGRFDGIAGISETFLIGSRLLNASKYKVIGEKGLTTYPNYLTIKDFSQTKGLAGIGNIYLTAGEITGSEFWWERADWVTEVFARTFIRTTKNNGCFWYTDNMSPASACYATGTSGIIAYLLEYFKVRQGLLELNN